MAFISVTILIFAVCIAYQDFKRREINLLLLIGFMGLVFLNTYLKEGIETVGIQIAFSLCYLFISLAVIKLYYLITKRPYLKLFDHLIGWGDLLMIIGVGIGLPVEIQIPFYLICFLAAIIAYYLFQRIKTSIPLAAYLAINYCIYLVFIS